MSGAIAWFARNHVAANLLMLFIIGAGVLSLTSVVIEVFPEFSADIVSVSVPYPGAAPEEVEEAICMRVEEELVGLTGVKRVRSTAAEGAGTVQIEVLPGADVRLWGLSSLIESQDGAPPVKDTNR